VVLALVHGCGGSEGGGNQPPTAVLEADSTLKVRGVPFAFDASASDDPDGTLVHYRYVFADGTPAIATSADGTTHAFPRTGVYNVQLTVVDDDGGEGSASLTVTVVDPECEASTECEAPTSCVDGLCQCPSLDPPCGAVCCDAGESCQNGQCRAEGCQPPLTDCGGYCADLEEDENNCGSCGRVCYACELGECRGECPFGQTNCGDTGCTNTLFDPLNCGSCGRRCGDDSVCSNGECVPNGCPPGWGMCAVGGCVDLSSDPFNCGGCGNVCIPFECVNFMCADTMGDPGSVLETLPAPPYQRITGMTYQGGSFYLMTGRRFSLFDPWSGFEIGNWFITDEANRRANGLAAQADGLLLTGAFDRFDPVPQADLEAYFPFDEFWFIQLPGLGGPITLQEDAGLFWVFDNVTQELVALEASMPFEISRNAVSGLDFSDRFTDLAYDGYGNVWAVRPELDGFPASPMKKISLTTFSVVLVVDPPDSQGVGGIVVAEGVLWGAGRNGVWRMVP
jgi:hypothetical protein